MNGIDSTHNVPFYNPVPPTSVDLSRVRWIMFTSENDPTPKNNMLKNDRDSRVQLTSWGVYIISIVKACRIGAALNMPEFNLHRGSVPTFLGT